MIPLFDTLMRWWRARRHARLHPEAAIVVGFDEAAIWCITPREPRRQIAWAQLRRVVIHTTDAGPFQPDVFWHLEDDSDTRIVFPNGATGSSEALDRLQELPDFDNHALMASMFSTDNAVFVCWQRPEQSAG